MSADTGRLTRRAQARRQPPRRAASAAGRASARPPAGAAIREPIGLGHGGERDLLRHGDQRARRRGDGGRRRRRRGCRRTRPTPAASARPHHPPRRRTSRCRLVQAPTIRGRQLYQVAEPGRGSRVDPARQPLACRTSSSSPKYVSSRCREQLCNSIGGTCRRASEYFLLQAEENGGMAPKCASGSHRQRAGRRPGGGTRAIGGPGAGRPGGRKRAPAPPRRARRGASSMASGPLQRGDRLRHQRR